MPLKKYKYRNIHPSILPLPAVQHSYGIKKICSILKNRTRTFLPSPSLNSHLTSTCENRGRPIYKYRLENSDRIVSLPTKILFPGEAERVRSGQQSSRSIARRPSRTHCSIMQCRLNRAAEARFQGGHIPRRSVVLAPAYHRPANRGE